MGNPKRSLFLILVLLFLFALGGCSGGSDSDALVSAGGESSYTPGASVNAVAYNEAADITLFIWDEGQEAFVELSDGEYVDLTEQQTKTLGVKVEGGTKGRGRVFISDGGANQVEAVPDDTGYYVCDFMFGRENLIWPVLIQEIYSDGYASKKKIILRTRPGAKDNELVRDGLGIQLSKEFLATGALDSVMMGMSVSPSEVEGAILDALDLLPINIMDGLGVGYPPTGDKEKCYKLDEEYYNNPVSPKMIIDSPKPLLSALLKGLIEETEATSMCLNDVLGDMGGDDPMMNAVFDGLNLVKKWLLIDLYGMPDKTSIDAAALGAGLYPAYDPVTGMDEDEKPFAYFPEDVYVYDPDNNVHSPFMDRNLTGDISVDFSQDNLSQFVGGLLANAEIILDAGALPIPLAIPGKEGVLQKMHITFNRAGVAVDMTVDPMLLILNDLKMEYYEANVPVWQISLDMTFEATLKSSEEDPSTLVVGLSLVPQLSHCHVMKDNLGIGLFDHSVFIEMLVEAVNEMLGGTGTTISYPLSLADMGIILGDPIATSLEAGRCFLDMAIEDIDTSGLCFISSAGI
ncbi:MAG: hypothetical protein U9P49_08920 [Thermodesulfobacteriota bacterium]|nr:hypothetical protein [Thermodesulfobacteriota bacterium]